MGLYNDPIFGAIMAPDDATPEEIEAAMAPNRALAQRQQQLQRGLGALGQAVQGAFAPAPQMYPKVSGVAAMAMGDNYKDFQANFQAAQQREQQKQQADQRNALQERMLTQQALQSEKDRSDKLKLAEMTQKNTERTIAINEAQGLRDQARLDQETAESQEPQFNIDESSGGYWVTEDGQAPRYVLDPAAAQRIDQTEAAKQQALLERTLAPYEQYGSQLGSVRYVELEDGKVIPMVQTGRNSGTLLAPTPQGGVGRMGTVPDQTPSPVKIENPDGTVTTISLAPGETSGPPITAQGGEAATAEAEYTPSLDEIASQAGDANKKFTQFVTTGRRYGYPDEVLAQYAAEKGIADDQSYVPFRNKPLWGKTTTIEDVPKPNPAYQAPAGTQMETYSVPATAQAPPQDGAVVTMQGGKQYKFDGKRGGWVPVK